MKRIGPIGVCAVSLALLCLVQLACVLRAPAYWLPSRVDISLRPGESVTLGRQELAAPSADAAQLGLRRDVHGDWWVRDATGARPFTLRRDGTDSRSGAIVLAPGQRFQLGMQRFTIDRADARAITLGDGAHRWRYDGGTVSRDGVPQPGCPDARHSQRLVAAWNRHAPAFALIPQPLQLGGNLYCGPKIGVAGTQPASASIRIGRDGPLLATNVAAALAIVTPDGPQDLARLEAPLKDATAITAGRTHFAILATADVLSLRPTSHVALFAQAEVRLPPNVRWTWQRRDPWMVHLPERWSLAAAAALILLLSVAAGLLHASKPLPGRRLEAFALGAAGPAIACTGLAALAAQRLGAAPGVGISLLLAWSALWYALLAPRRFNAVAAAGVLLLAIGLLSQLELGLGAMESSWLRHFQKTAALAALGLGAGFRIAIAPWGRIVPRQRFEAVLLGAAALALLALALQVAVGSETGVFDIQPVEFAKLALAALAAYCLALAFDRDGASAGALLRCLRLLTPAALFVALLAVALVQVDDYSPLVLLLAWANATALAWAFAARQRAVGIALAGVACAAVLGVGALRTAGAAEADRLGFYADRFQVWLDPVAHPHTGRQLLLGAQAIADGGWLGADHLLGLATLGQGAGAVMRVPAVQDDFAPSFFLNRHGLLAALALWLLQALLLTALLREAVCAWLAAAVARDFRQAWFARFRCFALCGGAAFLFGHFLLSWGTNLAIFPVMGQPMSFLSAGGSHLLLFICPLLAFGAARTNPDRS
ncbi:FtsW/RodA/SpoVE family cell cycle protein [Massilia solisilvae]|uniref:Probable peptidoglycan glycosyltransferase FtsW n=1 Tax=Massilia solisilvae TaxID=1811225 RepID=A0ABT2BNG5_9BURK|nr:FtsW/RodA/SpoVE family cell cycle protein [Massilia solisilvae]MCS0609615.1 FtsW/RodA/SpoVE family cell cycle protein [Massilia solisilvae]